VPDVKNTGSKKMSESSSTKTEHDATMLLQVCVATIGVDKEIVPANFKAKPLRFGHCGGKINAVVDIEVVLQSLTPPEMQACFCSSIGVSENYPMCLFSDLCKGKLPDDVIVVKTNEAVHVLWFVLTPDESLAVIDIAKWDVFPCVKISDFSCVVNSLESRVARQTQALLNLSEAIDDARFCLTDGRSKTIQDKLKCVYDECNMLG
jgi:hypothetical protein